MNDFGYPSKEPCYVCGRYYNNQSEPRFSYTVCEFHQQIPPARLDETRAKYGLVSAEATKRDGAR